MCQLFTLELYSFNENSTLLDIGSGSGKVLLCMQAMLPFSLKKVYGTEIVKYRSDFAKNLLNKYKEHLGKHNITFANTNFNYDDFIQNGTWTHVVSFDQIFPKEFKVQIAAFLKEKSQINNIYFISSTSKAVWEKLKLKMTLLQKFSVPPHLLCEQGITLSIFLITKND